MKYYISELLLSIDHGDYVHNYGQMYTFKTDEDAKTYVDHVARSYYDDVEEDEDGNLLSRRNNTYISRGHPYEIKKDTFDDLKSAHVWEA